jgi:tyrosyl-tRNA synthetase
MNNLLQTLTERGLVYQHSPGIEDVFANGTTLYLGYDPTGPDLHIGHLLGITVLKRAYEAGQNIIVLVGGGTSMIGDPGGKDAERPILPKEQIEANKEQMKQQFSRFFEFDGKRVRMVDNADWLEKTALIDFLREAGKYISINSMLDKDSVSSRISREEGISYAEFSYQLLQAFDYLRLYQEYGCAVQIGGSDQWGNIIQGVELIRKRLSKPAYALSYPLIVNPKTGKKFGKTESGEGIWLNAEKTHPFHLYQFLLNTDDELAPTLMKYFSFRPMAEITEIITIWEQAKHERLLQKELAREVTAMVHGEDAARHAEEITGLLFAKKHEDLTDDQISFIMTAVPHGTYTGDLQIAEAAAAIGLTASLSEARRLVQQNGMNAIPLRSTYTLIRKGKKEFGIVKREEA